MNNLEKIVFGFCEDCSGIYFRTPDDDVKFIKCSLPKHALVGFLGIESSKVNKKLKDEILNIAYKKGKFKWAYSLEGKIWYRDAVFKTGVTQKSRLHRLDEWKTLKTYEEIYKT